MKNSTINPNVVLNSNFKTFMLSKNSDEYIIVMFKIINCYIMISKYIHVWYQPSIWLEDKEWYTEKFNEPVYNI